AEEEGSAISVQAQVQEKARRVSGEVRPTVADEGNRAAAKIEGPAVRIADDLDAVGVVPLLDSLDRNGQGGHIGVGSMFQKLREKIQVGRVDERFIALQVDDHIGV